jgi:uncharacterized membrane protein
MPSERNVTMQLNEYTRNLNAVRLERMLSLIGGSALLSYGIAKRKPMTLPLAIVGGGLVYHAVRGNRATVPEEWQHEKGQPSSRSVPYGHGVRVDKSVTINRSPEELYSFWRNLENLPRFMSHLRSVQPINRQLSHWVADAPGGTQVEWDAEIVNDVPNELIAWRSSPDSDIPNAGSVRFMPAPGGRGKYVNVELEYSPPGGPIGAAFAKLFGKEPSQTIGKELHRPKNLMETGQFPTVEGQPHGSRNVLSKFYSSKTEELYPTEEPYPTAGSESVQEEGLGI